MRWVSVGCLLGAAIVFSCGGDEEPNGGSCPAGTEGCACYGNSTCDDGLGCEADRCRAGGGDAGGPGASEGGAPTMVGGGGSGGDGGATTSPEAGAGAVATEPDGGSPAGSDGGSGGDGNVPGDDLVAAKLACGSRDVTGAKVVSGVISQSQTWSGVVHVTASVSVKNEATLTIQPGTKIIVAANADIQLGAEGSAPRLVALGTVDAPISFCGETAQGNNWGGLKLRATASPESALQNVLIEGGGYLNEGALRVESKALLRGVQLQRNLGTALAVSDFSTGSDRVTIYAPLYQPVQFLSLRGATHFPDNSQVNAESTPTVTPLVLGIQDPDFKEPARLRDLGLPYVQTGDVRSIGSSSAKLTFDAGVVYQLPRAQSLFLYGREVEMLGTAERPVRFEHLCDGAACSSGGGQFQLGDANMKLENVVFAGLGSSLGTGVTLGGNAVASIENVRVEKSGSTVALELGAELAPGSSGLVVQGTRQQWLEITNWDALRTLPADTVAPNEDRVAAEFQEVASSGTLKAFAFDVRFRTLVVTNAATLTVEPGARLRFTKDVQLRVYQGGTLHAVGSAAKPILFSQVAASNAYWGGISVESGGATLEHAVVEFGGGAFGVGEGANIFAGVPISLKNSTIRNSSGRGLAHRAADTTDYTLTNTFSGNLYGDVGSF